MRFARVPLVYAEEAKRACIAARVLIKTVSPLREEGHLLFPVTDAIPVHGSAALASITYVERDAEQRSRVKPLKDMLAGVFSPEEQAAFIGGHDVIGSIAIVEIPELVRAHTEVIAAAVLEAHPTVSTVLAKRGQVSGEFRTPDYECIAGIDTRETIVVESGCTLLVDVERVYYSPRLGTERLRIARAVTPDERVLVLGAGAGPYTVVLAKHSLASRIVGVEKNPVAHQYAVQNLRRNKCPGTRVATYEGDASSLAFLSQYGEGPFDRIVIAMPHDGPDFIAEATSLLGDRAVVHVGLFSEESALVLAQDAIIAQFAALGWRAHVDHAARTGHHKPYVYRWTLDVTVQKST